MAADPVLECVCRLRTNDPDLDYLCLDDVLSIPPGEGVDADDYWDEYEGRNVDEEVTNLANALAINDKVEFLDFHNMRDKISKTGAVALGLALAQNTSVHTLDFDGCAFDHDGSLIAIVLSHMAKNKRERSRPLSLRIEVPYIDFEAHSNDIVWALCKLMDYDSQVEIYELELIGVAIDGEMAIPLAERMNWQSKHLEKVEILMADSSATCSCWSGYAICRAVGIDTQLKLELELASKSTLSESRALKKLLHLNRNIQHLELSYGFDREEEIGLDAIKVLAEAFRNNLRVPSFKIERLVTGGEAYEELFRAIVSSRAIKKMEMRFCNLGTRGSRALGEALRMADKGTLSSLDLDVCSIPDDGARFLASGLFGNKTLRELVLQANPITGLGLLHLAKGISSSAIEKFEIRDLSLSNPEKSSLSLKYLCGRGSPLKRLNILNWGHWERSPWEIDLSSIRNLLAVLENNRQLESISLSGVKSEHIIALKGEIAKMLTCNCNLEELNLCNEMGKCNFSTRERTEMNEMLLDALHHNHKLKSARGLLELNRGGENEDENRDEADEETNSKLEFLLNCNQSGIIAAAALKGVPLPSLFTQGLPDSSIPEAIEKIGNEASLRGIYSFLRQMNGGNLIASHKKYGPVRKKRKVQANISNYFS